MLKAFKFVVVGTKGNLRCYISKGIRVRAEEIDTIGRTVRKDAPDDFK